MFDFDLFPNTVVAYHLNEMNRHIADRIDGSASGNRHQEWVYFSDRAEAQAFEDEFTDYIFGAISRDD